MSKCPTTPKVEPTDKPMNVNVTDELASPPELSHQVQTNWPTSSEECTLPKSKSSSLSESNPQSEKHNEGNRSPRLVQNKKAVDLSLRQLPSPITHNTPHVNAPLQVPFNTIHQPQTMSHREKTKGVSLLSRLAIKGGKKKELREDSEIIQGKFLTEGMNAHVFSSSVNASGFVPQHKEPPSYIRVRSRNKKPKVFKHMFLAQELYGSYSLKKEKLTEYLQSRDCSENKKMPSVEPKSSEAVWAMEFSLDGRYLVAAGCDQIVRIWAVLSTPEERQAHEYEEDVSSELSECNRLSAPVFKSKPIREYSGHTGGILDVNWSKNNFLLTSSVDRMVKLWHPSRQECLSTFSQKELITSISFHPTDDRFFLSGSLDRILRLWSIPEKKVVFSCESLDPITAVAFTPNGSIAIAGGFTGLCHFYDVDQDNGLRLSNQIHVRSSRGKNAKGSKITGIKTLFLPSDDQDAGDVNILITSNDSRIRLYTLKDKRLRMKFQGHQNTQSQIKASFSYDGRYVICGSEDRKTYLWGVKPEDSDPNDPPLMEVFTAHSSMVTTAIFAPASTRQLLSGSGDPIYEVCNPPPVTLLSLEEHYAEVPQDFDDPSPVISRKTEVTPAYLARTSHDDGPIILTSDLNGSVKCFRIDCAFEKRHQWDASSTFSKKRSSIRRSNSFMTPTSTSSRQNSFEQPSSQASLYHENILNWRGKVPDGLRRTSQREGSASPENLFSDSNQYPSSSTSQNNSRETSEKWPQSPSLKGKSKSTTKSIYSIARSVTLPPTPGFTLTNTVSSDELKQRSNQTTKSGAFWNKPSWRSSLSSKGSRDIEKKKESAKERDNDKIVTGEGFIDISSVEENQNESSDSANDRLYCEMCEGKDFRARKLSGKGLVMVCVGCGVIIG